MNNALIARESPGQELDRRLNEAKNKLLITCQDRLYEDIPSILKGNAQKYSASYTNS